MSIDGKRPKWLTFDCYGTLIQWDEGLRDAVRDITTRHGKQDVDPNQFLEVFDDYEYALETSRPHKSFRIVASQALQSTMAHFNLPCEDEDVLRLTDGISSMPPFPESVQVLAELKGLGFQLAIISNTDDDIIAGNVAQLAGTIDRVITAQQAQAYKPSPVVFDYAHRELGVSREEIIHICASPHIDLAAARDMGFRCIWINRGTPRAPLSDYTPNFELMTLASVPELFRNATWT